MSSTECVWYLERYARYKQQLQSSQTLDYQDYYDNQKEELKLIVDQGSLLLLHGKTVMESYLLSNAKTCLSGLSKGDTMRVTYQLNKEKMHSFRMKFAKTSTGTSGQDVCRKCAKKLSSYFSIKIQADPDKEVKATISGSESEAALSGEVTLSSMTQALTEDKGTKLPKLYQDVTSFHGEHLNTILKLCLSDPGFPAFVDKVEGELSKIKNEN